MTVQWFLRNIWNMCMIWLLMPCWIYHQSQKLRVCWSLYVFCCKLQYAYLFTFRSRPLSRPNKVGLDFCPYVHLYFHPQIVLSVAMKFGACRGRQVMHNGISYDPIQGQCQGHESLKFENSSIFKNKVRGIDCHYCTGLIFECAFCHCVVYFRM